MSDKLSTHLPEFAGGSETFIGTTDVDTGLREIQGASCSLGEDQVAGKATCSCEILAKVAGQPQKLRLSVWEDDNTTAATVSATVNWLALGK